jgi:ABC-2 type transport system ATP-binding protein
MDEAERCHRLAFIFRGALMDMGTPEQVVERRGLSVCELEVDDALAAEDALKRDAAVESVSFFGHTLRVTVHGGEAEAVARAALSTANLAVGAARPLRPTVEDAFVSLVRHEEREA